ncbi:DUF6188 family protein [Yinghuangia sp. YIM S09857]|uniref:DUF6188 family protein n=1 Tax=Yinghuangia sp. YIM S09857 TaxID=3436929 RepID=UPI003F538555
MSMHADPMEHDDRWLLNLRGVVVTGIGVDFRLTLRLGSDWVLALEDRVRLARGPGRKTASVTLDPETQDVAAALALFGTPIASAVAVKSGALSVVFGCGTHLTCGPSPAYDAWTLDGPRGWRFTSHPPGELAVRKGSFA